MFNLISDNRVFQCLQYLYVNILVIMLFDIFFNFDLLKIYKSDCYISFEDINIIQI